MHLISRYKQLSPFERKLFFQALALVAGIRAGLWLLPFRKMRDYVSPTQEPSGSSNELDRRTIRQVAWAVEAASRRVPSATCLTQSMATQFLLRRLGQTSELCLGVARKSDGHLEAHAWVEAQGRIVSGGKTEEIGRYTRLSKQTS